MADQFFHQGQQGSSFGGCQQGGEEDRVVHGGVLSRSVGHSKNLHDALENTAFQAKKVLTVRELSPAKKRKQRFFLGNFWNAVTAPNPDLTSTVKAIMLQNWSPEIAAKVS